MKPMNREQRRHPERTEPAGETAGAHATGAQVSGPEDAPMIPSGRMQDDDSVRAKNTGHKKKTAGKWNQ
jgi:hypothetical protein